MEGISPISIVNADRIGRILRLTHRRAPGRKISRRILLTASSCEADFSTSSMTFSTSFNSPGKRADKQSGRKLNVRCPIEQCHLAIFVPSGYFLLYVPFLPNPHPPSGWIGQLSSFVSFQASLRTYSSADKSVANRSCMIKPLPQTENHENIALWRK